MLLTDEKALIEVDRRGEALYAENLKRILEPAHNGEWVAIHLDSGDYAVHKNAAIARRTLRERHADGMTYSLIVGPVTANEIARTNRLASGSKS